MKRKLDIIRNQICGNSRRLSPTSVFVASRLEGKLRPNWPTARGTIMTDGGFHRTNALQSMQELQQSPVAKDRELFATETAVPANMVQASATGSVLLTPQNSTTPTIATAALTPKQLPNINANPQK